MSLSFPFVKGTSVFQPFQGQSDTAIGPLKSKGVIYGCGIAWVSFTTFQQGCPSQAIPWLLELIASPFSTKIRQTVLFQGVEATARPGVHRSKATTGRKSPKLRGRRGEECGPGAPGTPRCQQGQVCTTPAGEPWAMSRR